MHNPYYSPEKLGLEIISFDEPGLSWEYNTACFFFNGKGDVYFATDSGCSCPTPFDNYSSNTQASCFEKMERVENFEMAAQLLRSWGKGYRDRSFITQDDINELKGLFNE